MSTRNKQILLSITGIIILITSLVVELPVYAMSAFLSPLPEVVGTCATVVNGDFELSGLGYVDHEDDTTTFTLSLKVNATKALLHVAFILDTWQPVEPVDGDPYPGKLGEYKVKWKNTNNSPNPVTVQFEPKFNSFRNGASDSFAVRVQDFVPTDALTIEVKAGENIQTFTTSFSDFACDRTPEISLPPLDLVTDNDADGQPDELMTEIGKIETEWKAMREKPNKVKERKFAKAITRFTSRMPFNRHTREIQQQMADAYQRLGEVTTDEERNAVMNEISSLEVELYSDPSFKIVNDILQKQLDEQFDKKIMGGIEGDNVVIASALSPSTGAREAEQTIQASQLNSSDAINLTSKAFLPSLFNFVFAPDPECKSKNTQSNGQAKFGDLQRGYLLLYKSDTTRKFNFIYARKFTHGGMYHGKNSEGVEQVYESNQAYTDDLDGGPRLWNLDTWKNSDACVAIGYYDTSVVSLQSVSDALAYRETQYGPNGETPYPSTSASDLTNYWLNKSQNSKIYCSLLVWKVYDHTNLVNIDSNDPRYILWFSIRFVAVSWGAGWTAAAAAVAIVAPDEIYLHPSVIIHSEGVNP